MASQHHPPGETTVKVIELPCERPTLTVRTPHGNEGVLPVLPTVMLTGHRQRLDGRPGLQPRGGDRVQGGAAVAAGPGRSEGIPTTSPKSGEWPNRCEFCRP